MKPLIDIIDTTNEPNILQTMEFQNTNPLNPNPMTNPIFNIVGNTYTVQVTDSLTLDITIVMTQSGDISYTFKTPKGWGGRHYYSLCNQIADAFDNQLPAIYKAINLYNSTL